MAKPLDDAAFSARWGLPALAAPRRAPVARADARRAAYAMTPALGGGAIARRAASFLNRHANGRARPPAPALGAAFGRPVLRRRRSGSAATRRRPLWRRARAAAVLGGRCVGTRRFARASEPRAATQLLDAAPARGGSASAAAARRTRSSKSAAAREGLLQLRARARRLASAFAAGAARGRRRELSSPRVLRRLRRRVLAHRRLRGRRLGCRERCRVVASAVRRSASRRPRRSQPAAPRALLRIGRRALVRAPARAPPLHAALPGRSRACGAEGAAEGASSDDGSGGASRSSSAAVGLGVDGPAAKRALRSLASLAAARKPTARRLQEKAAATKRQR